MTDDKLRVAVEQTIRKCAAWARQMHKSAGVEVSQKATLMRKVAVELAIIVSDLRAALADSAEDEAYRIAAKMCPTCGLPDNNYCRDSFHATADAPPEPTDEMVETAHNFAWDRLAPNSHHKRMEIPSDARGFMRELLRAALAAAHTKAENIEKFAAHPEDVLKQTPDNLTESGDVKGDLQDAPDGRDSGRRLRDEQTLLHNALHAIWKVAHDAKRIDEICGDTFAILATPVAAGKLNIVDIGYDEQVRRGMIVSAPEDAPRGPWITAYAKHAPHIYSVLIPDRRWAFTGDRQEAEAVRDALNRRKGEKREK